MKLRHNVQIGDEWYEVEHLQLEPHITGPFLLVLEKCGVVKMLVSSTAAVDDFDFDQFGRMFFVATR